MKNYTQDITGFSKNLKRDSKMYPITKKEVKKLKKVINKSIRKLLDIESRMLDTNSQIELEL